MYNDSGDDSPHVVELKSWFSVRKNDSDCYVKRFCVLHEHQLVVYFNSVDDRIDNSILLNSKSLIDVDPDSRPKWFSVGINESNFLKFEAEKCEVAAKWITSIAGCYEFSPIYNLSSFHGFVSLRDDFYGNLSIVQKRYCFDVFLLQSIIKSRFLSPKKCYSAILERAAIFRFPHPFIAQLLFSFHKSSELYFGYEYIPGGSLNDFISIHAPLPLSTIRLYTSEIIEALSFLHSMGIFIGDLSSNHVLLASDGHLKLFDLIVPHDLIASGAIQKSQTDSNQRVLAPEYNASGPSKPYHDAFALGVIMYQMITGELPSIGTSIDFPIGTDKDLSAVVLSLLRSDPAERANIEQVKSMLYFQDIDWTMVRERSYTPDYIPSNIDISITSVDDCDCFFDTIADSPPPNSAPGELADLSHSPLILP